MSARHRRRGFGASFSSWNERLEPRLALTATPIGDSFLVNDFTAGVQSIDDSTAAVAASEVNRVVVYEGRGPVDSHGVFARVYGADGAAVGDAFRVNSVTRGEQYAPAVDVAADGSFAVVWAGRGIGDKDGIFLQRFDSAGARVGGEEILNNTRGGVQTSPSVSIDGAGSIVVAWEGAGRGDAAGVHFKRLPVDGSFESEARVNSTVLSDQQGADITYLAGGEFVVTWQSRGQDGSGWGVYGQLYSAASVRLGGEFQINTTTANAQSEATISATADGGFVVGWQSRDQDGDGWGVVARRFAADATPLGDEFLLNADAAGHQIAPTLAAAADGQFVASWAEANADGAGWETNLRSFAADDTGGASEVVHSGMAGTNSGPQRSPGVAIAGDDALVVWSGAGAGDREGVHARAYGLTVDVEDPQEAPVLDAIADRTAEVGAMLSFTVTATDPNAGDTLTFTLDPANSPAGASIGNFDNNTAIINWTPGADDADSVVDFRVIVTDNGTPALSDSQSFVVEVGEVPLIVDLNGDDPAPTAQAQFVIGDIAVSPVAPNAEILGAENGMIDGATVQLSTAPDGDLESLSVDTTGTAITASYDAPTRTLTLTGSDTSANYEQVLRTLVYVNDSPDASGERLLGVRVTDSAGEEVLALLEVDLINADLVAVAQAIADSGAQFFGAAWCPACTAQKELFEDGGQFLPFVEVTNPDRSLNQVGVDNNISEFPTWVFADGTRLTGLQPIARLAARAGVTVDEASAPFLVDIEDTTLLVGSPLHVSLDGYDALGGPLTYSVSSDNPEVTAEVLSGNRSARVDVAGYGDMVFELFEQRAPLATARMIALADADFYDDVIFHRVIDNFVIQGGDPTGTGSGGSTLGDFDDQFHPDLQHNRTGLLSMAKSADDTNDSQFFVTEFTSAASQSSLRNLDYNHTVFGVLTEGEANRAAISDTAVSNTRPVNEVTMNGIEIFEDTENAVLMLKAADGATGSANITVTVTDQQGRSFDRTFRVDLGADPFNSRPYLEAIPEVITADVNTLAMLQLPAVDVEGDPIFYFAENLSPTPAAVDVTDDGVLRVAAQADFVGSIEVRVFVGRSATPSDPPVGQQPDEDFQTIRIDFV